MGSNECASILGISSVLYGSAGQKRLSFKLLAGQKHWPETARARKTEMARTLGFYDKLASARDLENNYM